MNRIKEWPLHERPRERLISLGSNALSDAELLSIVIGSGGKSSSVIEIARTLIGHFGGLRQILEADFSEITSCKGIGKACFTRLQATVEIVRRTLLESIKKGPFLKSTKDTCKFLKLKLRHYKREVFGCLFLDNQHRVIVFEELFQGTIDSASVHPREVVKRVLYLNAAAVIFAHNHPSGMFEPSHADRVITRELKEALSLVDVRVLDHIVVGDGTFSLAEQNMI